MWTIRNNEDFRLTKKFCGTDDFVKVNFTVYNKNTKLAEQQRKLVDEHFVIRGKVDYCSVDALAHYSYDWAQNVHVPHSDQQLSKIYYLSRIYLVYKMKQYANKLITFSMKTWLLVEALTAHWVWYSME